MQNIDAAHHLYPLEAWRITEGHVETRHHLGETLFALGNGYIGLRGTPEEQEQGPAGVALEGSYLNGFFESEPIQYPENAFGLARTNQFMVNVPNAKCIQVWIDGEAVDLRQGSISNYQRFIDFRTGVLSRSLDWCSPNGRKIRLHSERLVCFENKHLFAIDYQVTPLNFSGVVRLVSAIDGEVNNIAAGDDPRVGSAVSGPILTQIAAQQSGDFSAMLHATHNSGFQLATAMLNHVQSAGAVSSKLVANGQRVEQHFEINASPNQLIRLSKYCSYYSSRDFPEATLQTYSRLTLEQAQARGFAALVKAQQAYLDDFWAQADVQIIGDEALQQGIHFNQFHLLQSVGRDGKTNIAAKGLTGEGYEGHYFWDTEIYIFPFFLYNKPEIARKLLEYRYQYLPQARQRARQMSHTVGALYPWRTIAGEECSAYFPAGTAQYHINADIAYSIKLYFEVTGDIEFMLQQGAEIVLETARLWIGLGHFSEQQTDGQVRFCINEVTGPDEYTAQVNNNYYTNAMAKMHLGFAAQLVELLSAKYPQDWQRVAHLVAYQDKEAEVWQRAAQLMYLPYDVTRQIHEQDDSFLSKKVWDFAATPKENYPLLLHYHPLVIYRHQVCKQADVILALLLLSDQFKLDDKRRDFDFYEKVTTHDSSLSTCIFSIIAAEVGYDDKAYDYFMQTARLDIDNTHGNTHHGVHTAAMAGTWLGVAYGFAGMRIKHGLANFAPMLPKKWQQYRFHVHLANALLSVEVSAKGARYELVRGESIQFFHDGQCIELTQKKTAALCELGGNLGGNISVN